MNWPAVGITAGIVLFGLVRALPALRTPTQTPEDSRSRIVLFLLAISALLGAVVFGVRLNDSTLYALPIVIPGFFFMRASTAMRIDALERAGNE